MGGGHHFIEDRRAIAGGGAAIGVVYDNVAHVVSPVSFLASGRLSGRDIVADLPAGCR